jgi:hypothetical protein
MGGLVGNTRQSTITSSMKFVLFVVVLCDLVGGCCLGDKGRRFFIEDVDGS